VYDDMVRLPDLAGVRLLTDPLLRRHAGPLRRVGDPPDPSAWAGTDAVLVSHLHADHASLGSLRMLPGVPMLSGRGNGAWLRARVGATVPRVTADDWTRVVDRARTGVVEVRLVRADHHSRPMPHRPNGAHGHLLRGDGRTVWFAGDTSVYDDMVRLPDLAEAPIDVALLPIAGWGPRLSAGHMGPSEAVDAVRLVRPRAVLPIHHGTLHPPGFSVRSLELMHRPLRDFEREMASRCPEVAVLRADLGGSVEVA
jgi:L-ascorbate metabolism protein UlaG (beta-lactamase superfamily)